MHPRSPRQLLLTAFVLLAGCGRAESAPPPVPDTVLAADSGPSMGEPLRRFQAETPGRPAALDGGAGSREALVARFVAALEQGDGQALAALRVTRAEFAHLFFPSSIFVRPPYELPPDVVWMQLDAESASGARRAVRTWGGAPVGYVGLACAAAPQEQGASRLWGCDVRRRRPSGEIVVERMFGAILEHGKRFKFLSLANQL